MRTAITRAIAIATMCAMLSVASVANNPTRTLARPDSRDASRLSTSSDFFPLADSKRSCLQYRAPEPVSTREPLGYGDGARARLNFVVNSEGNVTGVMILNLTGELDQQSLIEAVIGWRFHPALCDGFPIDSEATLELQSRR
jgi:hypothetical protein